MGLGKKELKKIHLHGEDQIDLSRVNIQMNHARARLMDCFLLRNCSREGCSLKEFLKSFEEDIIRRTLKLTHGNQRTAAYILGIKATTLNEKIKRLDITEAKDFRIYIEVSDILKRSRDI